jgi:hypothetical protein
VGQDAVEGTGDASQVERVGQHLPEALAEGARRATARLW